jgi:DNA-binding MarR family transcriptional regulator
LVTALGDDMDLLPSIASRLSDRLADAGLITRSLSPTNRRATVLELTDAGRSVLAAHHAAHHRDSRHHRSDEQR